MTHETQTTPPTAAQATKHTPPHWLRCERDRPLPAFTPSWDAARGMWRVAGEFCRTFAEAREAQAARAAIAKATGTIP